MKFIEEKKMRDSFWTKYGYRRNILAFQFECQARHGGIDLLTIETVHGRENKQEIQFVSFEFKLDDIQKALAQAQEDLIYCHKSFIVIPEAKTKIIQDRYMDYLKKTKFIGVIGVAMDGKWSIIHQPWTQNNEKLIVSQEILKMLIYSQQKNAGSK